MPGYSYVKDSQGSVCGLLLSNHDYWFEDSTFMCGCNNFEAMAALMMKYGVFEEPEFNAILDGAMEKIRR